MLISRNGVVLALTVIGLVAGCASAPIGDRSARLAVGSSVATAPPPRSPSGSPTVAAKADRPPEPAPMPPEPTGRISLMTCNGATVTAVEIDAATGELSAEHVFPLHGGFIEGSDVRTDSAYNCYPTLR